MGLDEFGRIDRFFKPLATHAGALGLDDDAAVLSVAGLPGLVISTDAIVEGIHFRASDPVDLVAQKVLRTNLSDLAAMGAAPWIYTLVLAVRQDAATDSWLEQLASGLARDQQTYSVHLVGGDLVATPGPNMLAVTIFGKQESGRVLRRNAARPGEDLYVSGTIGDAALGLKYLLGDFGTIAAEYGAVLTDRYHLPQPRVALGLALGGRASAAMDISDGLAQDLGHLCSASGTAAEVWWPRIPLSPAARHLLVEKRACADDILGGGDDYELLFSAPVEYRDDIVRCAKDSGTSVTRIGKLFEGAGVVIRDHGGKPIALRRFGYRHG